ncbi:uncharacterized protein FYW61_013117 isoform 2-T2 [Anableps anableps]
MSQLEELKLFVAERLRAATSEILAVMDKTVGIYDKEVTRLKEENKRHSSLLEIILNKKLPKKQGCHVTNSATVEVAAKPAADRSAAPAVKDSTDEDSAAGPSALESGVDCKTKKSIFSSTIGQQTVFISKEHLLRCSNMGNCFFCFKQVPATNHHLMKRHYDIAVHFIHDGIEKFVIPCMCSEKIQERSHWHCPCCKKVIYRRCIFEVHLSKQHRYVVLQTNHVAGSHRLPHTVLSEEESSSPEDWTEEELSSLEQQDKTASLPLQIKEEEIETGKCLKVEDAQHIGNSQPEQCSLYPNQAQNPGMNTCLDNHIQDIREVIVMENGTIQVMKTHQNSRFDKVQDSVRKMQHPNETGVVIKGKWRSYTAESITTQATSSSSDDLSPPSKKHAKKQLAGLNLNTVKTELSASQNHTGSYYCKACGEIFHYFHKLKMHVQKHARDKICICGICGKSLMHSESLHEHLQNHNKKNICGTCGKQFSSQSRLQQHKTFHQPKTLNTKSTA